MLTTLLLSSPWAVLAQEPDRLDERLALLAERIEEARVEYNVPSLGFALVNRDGVIWQGGFGQADLESGRLADENTLYAIGSTTKAFTSALVGDLVDEGKLTWDVPIQEVVPVWTGVTLFESAGRKSPPAYVERVKRGSPARALGLRIDDLIVRIDDFSVRSCKEFRRVLTKYRPGDKVTVMWKRGTRVMTGEMTLAEEPNR